MRKILFTGLSIAIFAISAAHAGDANNGKTIFARCAVCHTVQKGGPNGVGPNLFGIVGRKSASLPGYMYSGALKGLNIAWTNGKLKAWVSGPMRMAPGTKMAFPGLSNPKQADDVVAYLNTLK
jgi:cytochrome c